MVRSTTCRVRGCPECREQGISVCARHMRQWDRMRHDKVAGLRGRTEQWHRFLAGNEEGESDGA